MVKLDSYVRFVSLQFSFSSFALIPAMVRRLERETRNVRVERKGHLSGFLVIDPIERCSLAQFPEELEAAGYEMVDALCEERIDPNYGRRTYYMVRFLFARREFVEISDGFRKIRNALRAELQSICVATMWRAREFSNPAYQGGVEIPGQRALSINLEARQPLFEPGGQPVMVWQKDENGRRVGKAPLKADHNLCISQGVVDLVNS